MAKKLTVAEKAIRKIVKKTTEDMTSLGTYRPQFNPGIRVYAEMKYQLSVLTEKFFVDDCRVTEEYTNKAGATNERKTALYSTLEQLRRDVAAMEDRLGLSHAGMKRINEAEMKGKQKTSKLVGALNKIGK